MAVATNQQQGMEQPSGVSQLLILNDQVEYLMKTNKYEYKGDKCRNKTIRNYKT